MSLQISRSLALSNIPKRKITIALEDTLKNCEKCSSSNIKLTNACHKCNVINDALQRYAKSNIPIRYWRLEFDNSFKGDGLLRKKYEEITSNLSKTYKEGKCICFAGSWGLGKTLTVSAILKRAVETGYSGLYVTLNDIVSNMISTTSEDKSIATKELLMVDFLVIDEFDPRYMGSSQASDLFGRTMEYIFRTRVQNMLPTFLCTNSPNIVESFSGSIKKSIDSLMNYTEMVPVLGKDMRKEGL